MRARGRGVGEVGAPRGAIASTLHSSEEREEEGDVDPTSVGPGTSLATRSPRPESITCPCWRSRAPTGCTGIALYGVLGGLRAKCSNAGVDEKTHEYKYFESREPVEVPHWDEKDSIRTLIDLHEKMACGSGIKGWPR